MSGPVVPKMQWVLQTRKTMSGQWPALRRVASEVEAEVEVGVPRHRSLQAALFVLDHLNVEDTFRRASVMKVVPKFLRGSSRNAMWVTLEEVTR